jgi:HD superfamily phosphohydrolase
MTLVVDPVHGRIELPQWVLRVKNLPEVRRMINIRQLGLKVYTGFPGAMHTRYVHSLGTMHLAEKLRTLLLAREEGSGREDLRQNLINNKAALQAAGFFHDIGHGPFSHVFDFVTRKEMGKDHAALSIEIIEEYKDILEKESIPLDLVYGIISSDSSATQPYGYIREIIDGPLDVDKMDYLLRDSYHVGFKYSFDLEHLMNNLRVLGSGDDLTTYQIGLADTPASIVAAEHFLLNWQSMYTLVYFDQSTRIAEKMLEKAVLIAIKEDARVKDQFSNPKNFLNLGEYQLLDLLHESTEIPKRLVESILSNLFYKTVGTIALGESFDPESSFMNSVKDDDDLVSDKMSILLSEGNEEYSIICDIVRRKTPRNIRLERIGDDGEPVDLTQVSHVVKAMSEQDRTLYVYIKPELVSKPKFTGEKIIDRVKKLIEEWRE